MAQVALVSPALAAARPVQPLPGQPLDVIAALQVMEALGHARRPRVGPAGVRTPVGRARGRRPPQRRVVVVRWLDELLPAPQQLLSALGELLALGLLADIIDEFPEPRLLQTQGHT